MQSSMVEQWKKQLQEKSGNLTTNEIMPAEIIEKLLDEDLSLQRKIKFELVEFPGLEGLLGKIEGLAILAGLQSQLKKGSLTLFRAVRFPTFKRIYETVSDHGYTVANHEQERILALYQQPDYRQRRNEIMSDHLFWTQPQERVVSGLPLFCLVNDALQIHRAYRGEKDRVLIVALHIPHELLETRRIRLIANTAIDLDYENTERDFEIKNFYRENGVWEIDFEALRCRGIDLHEMYTNDLPFDGKHASAMGIAQDFFLLDIYRLVDRKHMQELFADTELLRAHKKFLHGFFGDQNIFGRREATYLPYQCQKVSAYQ